MLSRVKNGPSNAKILAPMLLIAVIGYVALLFFVDPIVFNEDTRNESYLILHQVWLILAVVYTTLSFRFWQQLGPDDVGFRQFFGQPAGELRAGLPLVPLFLFSLKVFKRTIMQKEFPAEPENIYRGEMKDPSNLPEGKKPPIRQSFRTSISDKQAREFFGDGTVGPAEKLYEITNPHKAGEMIKFNHSVPADGLAKKRVTAELYPVLRWRIYNVENFVANIGSEAAVEQQIEDEIFSVLNRICQQISLAQALQNQQWLNAILFHAVAMRIKAKQDGDHWRSDEWGIQLESVFIKYPHISHGLNKAMADASQATFDAQKVVTMAEAEEKKLTKEGRGTAQAAEDLARAELKGFGDGLKEAAETTGMTAEEIAAAKVAGQVAEGDNVVILGEAGFTQLAAAATAVSKGIKTQKGDDA